MKIVLITLLALLFLSASGANASDKLEIRGPVANVEDGTTYTWGPQEFAGFYYDVDDDIGMETLSLTITDGALDEPNGIVYETTAQMNDFEFEEWGSYYTIGFFADEYFAAYAEGSDSDGGYYSSGSYLYDDSADENLMVDEQLSKVLIDTDFEFTFTTGTPLKLKEGYELFIQAIDLDGNKVYIELHKDGATVDSAVVEPSKDGATIQDKTYTYTIDQGDTEDIVVIAAHFKNAFRGAEEDLATVDGIWQISDSPIDVEEDTEYGKMTIQTVDSDSMTIMMDNEDSKITLAKNKDISLMGDIKLKTADTYDYPNRFYIYKEVTEPGTYEVRGSVNSVVNGATIVWDPSNFAGFYYDIDDDIGNEKITMNVIDYNVLDEPWGVKYEASAQIDEFKFEDWGYFYTMAFMGDLYFAGYVWDEDGTGNQIIDEAETTNLLGSDLLSKVLVNNGTQRVVISDETVPLEEGYALVPRIGTEGGMLVELLHEDVVIDRVALNLPATYVYAADFIDAPQVPIIAAHFQEPVSLGNRTYCKIDGLWQISDTMTEMTDVEEDTEYDKMTIQAVDPESMTIFMDNEDNKITLSKNKDISLMSDIRLKTADSDDYPNRFYIYKEVTISESEGAI